MSTTDQRVRKLFAEHNITLDPSLPWRDAVRQQRIEWRLRGGEVFRSPQHSELWAMPIRIERLRLGYVATGGWVVEREWRQPDAWFIWFIGGALSEFKDFPPDLGLKTVIYFRGPRLCVWNVDRARRLLT